MFRQPTAYREARRHVPIVPLGTIAHVMRTARGAGLVATLALVLTSCGLAALSSPALAPEFAAPAAVPAEAVRPAPLDVTRLTIDPAPIAKVVLPEQPKVAVKAALPAADLGDVRHIWQTLNNCGPASVVMVLSTFGIQADQEVARLALRGPDVRRGMSPVGVDPWVRDLYGLRAVWRNNGTNDVLKKLITNGFAPMVTQWMEDPSVSRIAHWRSVVGYDDAKGVFYSNDPMRGRYVPLDYDWFGKVWQPFSYRYLVVYRPQDEALVKAIVGDQWSERAMRDAYYERAKQEAVARTDSASLLAFGEAAYQDGHFDEAVSAFQQGLALGSAEGVFTLRGSYPQALRAIGRDADAATALQRLNATALVPTVSAPPPDGTALQLAIERALGEPVHFTP